MKPISFRLRKEMDADLIVAIQKTEPEKVAGLCRDGLRLMLGIRMTREAKIEERPITVLGKPFMVKIGNTRRES